MIYRILKDTGVVCKPFANDVKLYCFPPTPNYSLLSTRWLSGVTSGNSNSHQRNVSFLYSERKLPRPTEEWTTSFFNPEFYLLHGHRPSSSLKTSVCLTTGGRTICFLGDFNLPLAIQPSPKQEDYKIFLGYFMEYGLHQFVRSATSKGNKENILDLVISNKPRILSTIDVLCPIPTSDNNVISFSPNIPLSLVPQTISFLKLHLMTSSGQITTT